MRKPTKSELLSDYYTLEEWGEQIDRTIRSVQRMVKHRTGPPITYIGNTPFVRKEAGRDWLRKQERPMVRADAHKRRSRKISHAPTVSP